MARVPLRNGGQRRAGHRRRHHFGGPRIRDVMPPRPKKPASAFNLFIRHYFRTPMARNFHSTSASMRYAGQFWRSNPGVHTSYANEVRTSRANFARDLRDWKARVAVLKRPGNAFVFFSREFWAREGQGRPISEYGRMAGAAWRAMTPPEKQPYVDRANRAKADHARMISDIARGTARIEDFMRGGGGETEGRQDEAEAVPMAVAN